MLVFHFDEVDYNLKQVIPRNGFQCVTFPAKEIPRLQALYKRCIEAKKNPGIFSLMVFSVVSIELALFFLKLVPRTSLVIGTDYEAKKVVEALAWYQANLISSPTIEEVARAVHVSSTHLRRLFHKVQGMSPQKAFTHVQFERAKEVMLDSSVSLERIAENSGFGSASSFSRAFKLEFDVPPKIYRLKMLAERQTPPGSEVASG